MRKKFKMLVSLVLVVAMAMGFNITAFAEEPPLSSFNYVVMVDPDVGGTLSTLGAPGEANLYVNLVGVNAVPLPDGYDFSNFADDYLDGNFTSFTTGPLEAKRYALLYSFKRTEGIFADDLTVTINGNPTTTIVNPDDETEAISFRERDLRDLREEVDTVYIETDEGYKPGADMYDEEANPKLDVTSPSEGVVVSMGVFCLFPEDFDTSTITAGNWYQIIPEYALTGEDVVFEAKKYMLFAYVETTEGYRFADDADMDVYLNGEKARVLGGSPDHDVFAILVDFDLRPTYEFLDNTGEVKTEAGEIKELSFHIDAPLAEFVDLFVGDVKLVKDEDYKLTEGSTIVTFTDKGLAKINQFAPGKYDIKAQFTNANVALGSMTLEAKKDPMDKPDKKPDMKPDKKPDAAPDPNLAPKTGDAGTVSMMLVVMLMAAAVGVTAYRKREF